MEAIDYFKIGMKDCMANAGLKPVRLAEQIGETPSHVSDFFRGTRALKAKRERMAQIFNMSYMEMVKYGYALDKKNIDFITSPRTETIAVNGKDVKISEVHFKVRMILQNKTEREFLVMYIDQLYNRIQKKKRKKQRNEVV